MSKLNNSKYHNKVYHKFQEFRIISRAFLKLVCLINSRLQETHFE